MEIHTPKAEQFESEGTVSIKNTSDKEVIYTSNYSREESVLRTNIPLEAMEGDWEVVSQEEHEKWTERFENSQYKLYMKAETNNSGDISISGV
jgi:hypothetical protein